MSAPLDATESWRDGFSSAKDGHEDEHPPGQKRYRAIFISDVHLGTPGCQAEPLLECDKTKSKTRKMTVTALS